MNVFDLPPINATLNGLSTCLIALGWNAILGVVVYFMLYKWFPSTHFDELKQRYELKSKSAQACE
jgi:hypothetical protein